MSIEGPWGLPAGTEVRYTEISGRMEMTDEQLAKMALPGAGVRRQAVEAFVEWTRDVEDAAAAHQQMTVEESLCSCVPPAIDGFANPKHDCPWCELRKAFGLLVDA